MASLPNKPGFVVVPKLVASEALFVYATRELQDTNNEHVVIICKVLKNERIGIYFL
jgi:hypothetical protein